MAESKPFLERLRRWAHPRGLEVNERFVERDGSWRVSVLRRGTIYPDPLIQADRRSADSAAARIIIALYYLGVTVP